MVFNGLKKLNAQGVSHIIVPLLVVVGLGVAGTATLVASHAASSTPPVHTSASPSDSTTPDSTTKTKKTKKAKKHSVKLKKQAKVKTGKIVFQVTEEDDKGGKQFKGGVNVVAESTDKNVRCRHIKSFYTPNGSTIYSGHTDYGSKYPKNKGYVHLDSCTAAHYKLSVKVNADKYDVIGDASTTVTLKGGKTATAKFVVKRKPSAGPEPAAAATATDPATDPSQVSPPAVVTPIAPITSDQEQQAVTSLNAMISDVLVFSRVCDDGDQFGKPLADRVSLFAQNHSNYATDKLYEQVKGGTYQGDPLPLFGVAGLKCAQYTNGVITGGKVVSETPTTLTQGAILTIKAAKTTSDTTAYPVLQDVNKYITFTSNVSGGKMLIDIIQSADATPDQIATYGKTN